MTSSFIAGRSTCTVGNIATEDILLVVRVLSTNRSGWIEETGRRSERAAS